MAVSGIFLLERIPGVIHRVIHRVDRTCTSRGLPIVAGYMSPHYYPSMRDTLEQVLDIDVAMPEPRVVGLPAIDYSKGRSPYRAATVQALQDVERDQNLPPGQALVEIAKTVVLAAMNGDKHAAAAVAERLDGKPAQDMQLPAGSELAVSFVVRGPPVVDRSAWLADNGGKVYEGESLPSPPSKSR